MLPPIIYNNLWEPPKGYFKDGFFKLWSSRTDVWKAAEVLSAYNDIPEVSAIIDFKARCRTNARFVEVNENGDEQVTIEGKAIMDLLAKPNWMQDRNEFLMQSAIFRDIFGNEFLYEQRALGFNTPAQLFTLPQSLIKAEYQSKVPFFEQTDSEAVKYFYKQEGGQYASLNSEQVLHLNDNRINMKSAVDKDLILGESKLSFNKVCVNNMRGAYESRGVIIKRRGALGILSNDGTDVGGTIPLDEKEMEELQKRYSKYGGLNDQDQLIISPAKLKWQQMGVNPDKLGLFQEIEEDFNKLLDAYGTPSEVFVRSKGATYENQRQAEKGLYVRTIIPEANTWCSGLNRRYMKSGKTKIVAKFDHLPIFQEDLKARADALGSAITALSKALADQAITIEQYQDEIDKYGIKRIQNQK